MAKFEDDEAATARRRPLVIARYPRSFGPLSARTGR